jgi:hypothetical protein
MRRAIFSSTDIFGPLIGGMRKVSRETSKAAPVVQHAIHFCYRFLLSYDMTAAWQLSKMQLI